ncbi:MAG TPA: AMP-binding protein, partial [Pyrinomonadaceae bacterium]|nr:AMP-binding protein [Pyrinomonadaceae bacterium]
MRQTKEQTTAPAADGGGQQSADEARPRSSHPPRVPLHPDEPRTLAEVFERVPREHPKPDMLNYKRGGEWRSISAEEFLARARRIALGLRSLGVEHGERVAILSENCPEWTLADAACQLSGVIDVPIYPTQAPPQVCYILNDSGARVLFVQNRAAFARIAEAIEGCAALSHIILLLEDEEAADIPHSLTFARLEELGRGLEAERPDLAGELARAVEAEDLATIIYTSGTTGEPKGVMLTHSNLVSNMIDSGERLDFGERDTCLSVLPLSHVFERVAMYMYLSHGMTVFYAESLEKVGDNMREIRPTIVVAVPRLYEKIYGRIKQKGAEGGKAKAALLTWAVEVGKTWARLSLNKQPVPPLLG